MTGGSCFGCSLLQPFCDIGQHRLAATVRRILLTASASVSGATLSRKHDSGGPQRAIRCPIVGVVFSEQRGTSTPRPAGRCLRSRPGAHGTPTTSCGWFPVRLMELRTPNVVGGQAYPRRADYSAKSLASHAYRHYRRRLRCFNHRRPCQQHLFCHSRRYHRHRGQGNPRHSPPPPCRSQTRTRSGCQCESDRTWLGFQRRRRSNSW